MAYLQHLLQRLNCCAVIFDMDGTMIDNHRFHLQAWGKFLQNKGIQLTEEAYKQRINGHATREAIAYLYNNTLSKAENLQYAAEKESIYRQLYVPYIQPVTGLQPLLQALKAAGVPMAIATSAIKENVEFMFKYIDVAAYFDTVVDAGDIDRGKPDPEIYIKTAARLGVDSQNCLVFEDALAGIRSAKAAGMKVIALTTTNSRDKLTEADMIINDFTEMVQPPVAVAG
ncbi:HAD family hydrolase [Foetidibacter luteolus]|uniref:HAD family hydrolase n=1 Tax=Foetidibacter luteolus TaxID=2608880 RepID=UPI00129A9EF0|nr:HAD family phosphatase [Foetidibacter luteolus]